MPSLLEQYRIADFLEWNKQKRLVLNPDFQRGSVWKPAARIFLIDTILRGLPIPKVYLRTKVEVTTQKTIREIVDGQQRIRAILDFAEDRFVLSKRAAEFAGKKYSTLSEEQQERFLSYPIAVDQLVNASVDDVLEVFARLNSYTVTLNEPEKRHAKFQSDFKFAVRASSRKWASFWEKYEVFSVQQRVRMLDDSFTAELLGVCLKGIQDGGQSKITEIYRDYDSTFDQTALTKLDNSMEFIKAKLADTLSGSQMLKPAHLYMLFAAIAFVKEGIPKGELSEAEFGIPRTLIPDLDVIQERMLQLAACISNQEVPPAPLDKFWLASVANPHRIANRRVRFKYLVNALTNPD